MKRCPKCNLDYFDNALEFCLEDGTKLLASNNFSEEIPTISRSDKSNLTAAETVNLSYLDAEKNLQFNKIAQNRGDQPAKLSHTAAPNLLKEKDVLKNYEILEVVPIFLALAHNWWQWIYVNNQYYSSLPSFLISANFLMWLLLLIAGTVVSLFAVKKCNTKGFAYTSLVILSINLILFLVPKR